MRILFMFLIEGDCYSYPYDCYPMQKDKEHNAMGTFFIANIFY
jgi:hypothetical protein